MTPAWQRFPVTNVALAQRRHLCGELAARGLTANCIVIANDENLDIAKQYDFPTIEMGNVLGRKFNAGIKYAAEQGADFIACIGSDNWLHADVLDIKPNPEAQRKLNRTDRVLAPPSYPIITGRKSFIVSLELGTGRRIESKSKNGIIPWIVPRACLEPCGFSPIGDGKMRGIDFSLALGMGVRATWRFHDPSDICRVGWKSDVNLTTYEGLSLNRGYGKVEEDPWALLETRYPAELVALARKTHEEYV